MSFLKLHRFSKYVASSQISDCSVTFNTMRNIDRIMYEAHTFGARMQDFLVYPLSAGMLEYD